MLVYDITNEKSFDNIKNWIRNIEEHASSDVDRMIIGNKCDIEERRQVSRERGEQVRQLNFLNNLMNMCLLEDESSALDFSNLRNIRLPPSV